MATPILGVGLGTGAVAGVRPGTASSIEEPQPAPTQGPPHHSLCCQTLGTPSRPNRGRPSHLASSKPPRPAHPAEPRGYTLGVRLCRHIQCSPICRGDDPIPMSLRKVGLTAPPSQHLLHHAEFFVYAHRTWGSFTFRLTWSLPQPGLVLLMTSVSLLHTQVPTCHEPYLEHWPQYST